MEQKEVQEALLEKLSSIERNLHLIAFSMYLKQTEAESDVEWDEFNTANYESYLDEGMKLFDLDKINKKGKE